MRAHVHGDVYLHVNMRSCSLDRCAYVVGRCLSLLLGISITTRLQTPPSPCPISSFATSSSSSAESIFRSLGLVNKKDPYYDLVVRPKALKLDRCVWNRHAADAATCESVHGDTGKHLCSNAKITASGDGECSCC